MPSMSSLKRHKLSFSISNFHSKKIIQIVKRIRTFSFSDQSKANRLFHLKKSSLAIQVGEGLATIEQPAFAVTGINYEEDLTWVLIQSGVVAFWYFLIMPPIIMNWLRIRWYKRNLLEMYFQFMFCLLVLPCASAPFLIISFGFFLIILNKPPKFGEVIPHTSAYFSSSK
nr:NAD(P)H-quinone oxidoreductase subunit L, chloroplastic [Malus domestica]